MVSKRFDEVSTSETKLFDNRKEQEDETALSPRPLLTVLELAARLNVSVSWVYKRTKQLPRYGAGRSLRFDWAEVTSYLRKDVARGCFA